MQCEGRKQDETHEERKIRKKTRGEEQTCRSRK